MVTFTYTKPTIGGSEDTWGGTLNANWDAIAAFIGSLDSTELAVLDGITASTADLNLLDGVTVTLADITATAAEINYLSGVTSAIQDQIDNIPAPPELTQVQVEDDTSTVFGQVSGERLAQAVAANSAPLTAGAIGTYAWAWRNGTNVGVGFGDVVAGSELRPAGFGGYFTVNSNRTTMPSANTFYSNSGTDQAVLSGTWRAMGDFDYSFVDNYVHTLFLRIT